MSFIVYILQPFKRQKLKIKSDQTYYYSCSTSTRYIVGDIDKKFLVCVCNMDIHTSALGLSVSFLLCLMRKISSIHQLLNLITMQKLTVKMSTAFYLGSLKPKGKSEFFCLFAFSC